MSWAYPGPPLRTLKTKFKLALPPKGIRITRNANKRAGLRILPVTTQIPMADPTDHVADSLTPLQEKVQTYLALEREIKLLEVEMDSMQVLEAGMDEEPATDTPQTSEPKGQSLREKQQELTGLQQKLEQQREEVISLLPAPNHYITLHLDGEPVQVGYFTRSPETKQELPAPLLHITQDH